MAEKGGKGSPLFSKGKVADKSVPSKPGVMKGKDGAPVKMTGHVDLDSSDSEFEGFIEEKSPTSCVNGKVSSDQKSGKKKVSFESLKSGAKALFETPTPKGDWGKGGKGCNVGKAGGKTSLPQATAINSILTEVELKLELDLPQGARILMDCEAADVLEEIQEHMSVLSEDPQIKMPESFSKGLTYSKISGHYTNVQSVRQVLETLKMNGVTDGEICMIGNVCPETVEEAFALIPSLKANKHKNEGAIKDVLSTLAEFRTSK